MKYLTKIMYLLFVLGVVFACTKNEVEELTGSDDPAGFGLKTALSVDPPQFYCNPEPVVFDLIAGQHTKAGNVTLVNDENFLYITYETTDGSMLNEIHVYVGSPEGVPTTKKGIPIPGQFPYKVGNMHTNSYTLAIPLTDIEEECPIILTHAALSNGETAWGWEDEDEFFTFENYFDIKRWGYLGDYCITECSDDKYFTLKFWFYYPDGSSSWCILEAGEQFYFQSDWCDVMGVIKLDQDTTVNVRRYKQFFGQAIIDIQNDAIKVDIIPQDETIDIVRTYVFYGTLNELAAYGSCPDYPSFPHLFTGEDASSFEIPLN